MQLIYMKIQYLTDKKEFIEFSLYVSTEFSDKIFVITVKGLEPATQPPLVRKTRILPQHHQDTCERQDL